MLRLLLLLSACLAIPLLVPGATAAPCTPPAEDHPTGGVYLDTIWYQQTVTSAGCATAGQIRSNPSGAAGYAAGYGADVQGATCLYVFGPAGCP